MSLFKSKNKKQTENKSAEANSPEVNANLSAENKKFLEHLKKAEKKRKKQLRKSLMKDSPDKSEYERVSERILEDVYSDGGLLDKYLREQLEGYNPETNPLTAPEAERIIYGLLDLAGAERTRYMSGFVDVCKEGSEVGKYYKDISKIVILENDVKSAEEVKKNAVEEHEEALKQFNDFNSTETEIRTNTSELEKQEREKASEHRKKKIQHKYKMKELRMDYKENKLRAKINKKQERMDKRVKKSAPATRIKKGPVKNKPVRGYVIDTGDSHESDIQGLYEGPNIFEQDDE